ncbi:MAG: APC family permease, partial [Gemmatimonadaceae bacterium]|nr:APC family permease [Gemmatimonadaceae bacterium]
MLRTVRADRYRATLEAERPSTLTGRWRQRFEWLLFGAPLSSEAEHGERLPKWKALAIFASDALSSSAYATEEILLVLVLAGSGQLDIALPIAIAIALLLGMVVISYRQTVRAYPQGGGSYSVSRENLGTGAALVAAAALLTDYILTVAVSISAGTLAVTSAFPELAGWRVELAVAGILLITLINLRGVRESGSIFAIPTYLFISAFSALILVGLVRLATGMEGATLGSGRPPAEDLPAVEALSVLLILRAFASGATALTGVEAIANGVMAFRAPESRNASMTMAWMGILLATFFVSATFLATRLGIVPVEGESVLSQIGREVFGGIDAAYYFLQATTALVLFLAANTAFNDFPRLSSILARDGYMPRRFMFIGDRLTFSVGIVVLGVISAIVVVGFGADTHRLIPLYAIGVFIAFTLSQSGMFVHWRRTHERGWRRAAIINGLGAVATGIVALIVGFSKFT